MLRQYFVAKTFTAGCAGNRFTAQAIAPLYTLSRRFYFMHHQELNDLPEVARLHAELLRAIATGDERAAAVACDLQIDYAESFAKRIITRGF
jgi:DNA-binding GntR family transcriptional regulator